jgi:carboxyl-terminal processing protease
MDLGQQLFAHNRTNYGALKVTLQQFYLPDGQSTQLKGVPADVVLPSITAKMDIAEGDLKYALEHDTVNAAKHDLYSMVPADLLQNLRKQSEERVAKDEEFADLLRRVSLYISQKDQNTLSLEENAFMARRKELDASKEEEEEHMETQLSSEVVYDDNFYNREVINITHDYIEGLRKQNLAKAN